MNDDDDKLLADYDLSAWEAPMPPRGIADAVIARVGKADIAVSVAVDVTRKRRRTWLVAGTAAALTLLGPVIMVLLGLSVYARFH